MSATANETTTTKKSRPAKRTQRVSTARRKAMMIGALRANLGIVTQACKTVGIDRKRHYIWMNNDPKYKEEVEGITEETVDFAESSLLKQIQEKNTTATIFYLKTKGRKRGYVEAQININKDTTEVENLSDSELDDIIKSGA